MWHDPAMEGWRRALKGWAKELEWTQKVMTDAWLECSNDIWVRWSKVKAIEVRPAAKGGEYDIVLATDDERYIWQTKGSKDAARGTVSDLIRHLSGDWRQSA